MKFIQLTYFKAQKNYGNAGGKTDKRFLLAISHIVRITEYDNSIKLSLSTGQDIEVCETIDDLNKKFKDINEPIFGLHSLKNI